MPKGPKPRPIEYVVTPSGCHECTSHHTLHGYPRIVRDGKTLRLSRYLYATHKGEIPEGVVVRHTCDNRKCINLEHLILGTQRDNIQDRVERNRSWRPQGTLAPKAKLTEENVKAIRASVATNRALSNAYGVDIHTIRRVRNREIWRHVL